MVDAFVLMTVKAGSANKVVEKLNTLPEVKEVNLIYGMYDVLAKIHADTLKDLTPLILKIRNEIPQIESTSTLIEA